MSKPIINRTWRVTFIERDEPANTDTIYVIAPTKLHALWNAREQFFGAFMMSSPHHFEKVSLVRKPNMCRGGGR